MTTWRTVSIILKFFAAFACGCAAALTALGTSEESERPAHMVDLPLTDWADNTRLMGNFAIIAIEAIFLLVALILAVALMCKKFPKPSKIEYILLVLGCVFLLIAFAVEAWYSSCYDGESADNARDQGDVCIVQGWVAACVCLCVATIIYGIDAFIWYFCRKRCVTWIGWYYDDPPWEIPPKGVEDEEKKRLTDDEEDPEDPKSEDESPKSARSNASERPQTAISHVDDADPPPVDADDVGYEGYDAPEKY